MTRKPQTTPKPKLTDAERYKRFLDAAKEVGASDDPKDFDRVFDRITHRRSRSGPQKTSLS
jgi:hypothetical protein